MRDKAAESRLKRTFIALTEIEANELQATVLSFVFVFVLMAAYFILRPVRDALSSDWSDAQLAWLWTSTFAFSALAVSLYGAFVSRLRYSVIVPAVYTFFACSFLAVYLSGRLLGDNDLVNRVFYVWLSVFSLFNLSVFWTFMSGLFNKQQAKRLFGIIAMGASLGAIAGPAIPALFAGTVGTLNLLLVAALLLLVPLPIIAKLELLRDSKLGNGAVQAAQSERLSINPFSGFMRLLSSPYLLAIAVFILLYVFMSTFVYFELRKLLAVFDREVRARIWGGIDLLVNSLALLTALLATGRLATRAGMPVTLALVPLFMVAGWLLVALSPVLLVLAGLQVLRRAGNYAITRPGREMLFTLVDNEARYKAKPVIDIVVYRGGDMFSGWVYTALTAGAGFTLSGIAFAASALAAVWCVAGVYLGRYYERSSTDE